MLSHDVRCRAAVLVHTEKEWEKKEKRAAECQAAKEKKREELLTRVGRPTLWCRKQRATCRMPTHLRILPSRSKIEAAAKGLTVRSRILPCSSNGAIFSESSVVLCPFVLVHYGLWSGLPNQAPPDSAQPRCATSASPSSWAGRTLRARARACLCQCRCARVCLPCLAQSQHA